MTCASSVVADNKPTLGMVSSAYVKLANLAMKIDSPAIYRKEDLENQNERAFAALFFVSTRKARRRSHSETDFK